MGEAGGPAAADTRAERSRFRRVVADLGVDLDVATIDGRIAGLVYVTYVRPLSGPPRATLELLAVAAAMRGRGVGRALLAAAIRRASRRGCADLRGAPADDPGRDFLARFGWQPAGPQLQFDLPRTAD